MLQLHVYNYIKTILLPQNFEVHLFTLSSLPIREEYKDFYCENNVTIYSIAEKYAINYERKDFLNRIINLLRKLMMLYDAPKMDYCHIHSVYKTAMVILLLYKRKFKRIILSFWGGDIEDHTPYVIWLRERCFNFSNSITVTVVETYNEFQKIYGDKYNNKLKICRFATAGLNCIHEISKNLSREDCRRTYNIPPNRICITCGYSAYAEQHQDECLDIIKNLPESCQKRIIVVVPMQYGRFDERYISRVKQIAKNCQFPCIVLEEYVTFEISAQLAVATDIYIHVRDTDAFSNALKEHVYSDSLVIKGDWLKYPELEDMGAPVISIPTLDVLGKTLESILNSFTPADSIKLFDPIYELYSTDAIRNQWNEVIDHCK